MRSKKILLFSFLMFTAITLTRCGKENVCVAGIGTCATPPSSTQTQSGTEDLKLTVDSDVIKVNEKATFKATGGTKPYTFRLYQGQGNLIESTKTEDTREFEAPAIEGTSVIRVYDAKNNYKTRSITIEQ